jgi:hypothetical protein
LAETHQDSLPEPPSRIMKAAGLMLMLLAGGLEAWLGWGWLEKQILNGSAWDGSMLIQLALHTGLTLAGCAGIVLFRSDERGKSLAVVALLVGWFFPVVGVPAMMLMVFIQPGMARRAGLVSQFKHTISIQDRSQKDQVRIRDVVEFLADQVNIAPLADLVRSEDPRMRRGAIAALRKIKNPTAVKLLKEARGDPSPEMRVHAHVALTRLDNEMTEKLEEAIKFAQLDPDNLEALLAQARVSLDYINSGLLEEAALGHYIGLAKEPIDRILAKDPIQEESLAILGRLYLIDNRPGPAQRSFELLLKHHGSQADAHLGLCEALYMQGKYHLIQEPATEYRLAMGGKAPDRQAMAATGLWIS